MTNAIEIEMTGRKQMVYVVGGFWVRKILRKWRNYEYEKYFSRYLC